MKEVTLKEACRNVREKMKKSPEFSKEYQVIKEVLETIYEGEKVDDEFYEFKTEQEVLKFTKKLLSDEIKIEKMEIIPDKIVLIRGDAHYNLDEFDCLRKLENSIATSIKAFTGYGADVSL